MINNFDAVDRAYIYVQKYLYLQNKLPTSKTS